MLTEEQIKQRLGRITSSTVGAVLGVHPHQSPLQAWLAITEGPQPLPASAMKACERGNLLERVALEWGAAQVGGRIISENPTVLMEEWAADTTDAVMETPRGVELMEAKTVAMGSADAWGEEGTDEVPTHVLAQCHWHLLAHPSASVCHIPVIIGGYDFSFRLYSVPRDNDLAQKLRAQALRWHLKHVQGQTPPAPGPHESDTAWLKQRHPHATQPPLNLTPELEELAASYVAAQAAVKEAEALKATAGNALRAALRDASGGVGERFSISYREAKGRAIVDWQSVALECTTADSPFIQKHTRMTGGGRVLRVTQKKSKGE